jgi:uncharacterized protein YndB with AHSA1/START domain
MIFPSALEAPDNVPMLKGAERGCLVLADISGYTGLLVDTELEHAQDALRDLIQTVVGKLRPQLRLAKLEGDAAFVYSVADTVDGSQLLDTLESAYFAFRRRLDAISRATTCDCNACIRIPHLDLKFIAHYGSFVRQRVFGTEELTGSDVIVAHRLLKNSVAERVGHAGYLLITDACLAAGSLDASQLGFDGHVEGYDGIGEVRAWIRDLHDAWRHEKQQRRVRVTARDELGSVETDLPAPPAVVWSALTDPSRRAAWVPDVVRVDQQVLDGRRGVGTTNHCVHGAGATLEEILDWRPFDYFTMRSTMPGGLSLVTTSELTETPTGTHGVVRFGKPRTAREKEAFASMAPMVIDMYRQSLDRLGALVRADGAAGPDRALTPVEPAAAT